MPEYIFKCPRCETTYTLDSSEGSNCGKCFFDTLEGEDIQFIPLKRVYHLAGIAFKGNGFYKTDK